ncbi:MAG: hypothetical protein JKX83_04100 [Pseudomonadales bacterium]|nr:hypothetical protein [Pseudomonadales bacterium]
MATGISTCKPVTPPTLGFRVRRNVLGEDAYLRLHLLSECEVLPNEINLEGIFDLLLNVAWTIA